MSPFAEASPKGEARQRAIITHVRQVLLEEGYEAVSLRKTATALGMSVGNLQYYFPTKDDLVKTVISEEIEKPIEYLWDITWTPESSHKSIGQAVRSLLEHFAGDAGHFYAISEFLALHDPSYAKLKFESYTFILGYVGQLVGLIAPHLDGAQRDRLAHALVSLIDGASLQIQLAKDDDAAFDALVGDITKAMTLLLENWD